MLLVCADKVRPCIISTLRNTQQRRGVFVVRGVLASNLYLPACGWICTSRGTRLNKRVRQICLTQPKGTNNQEAIVQHVVGARRQSPKVQFSTLRNTQQRRGAISSLQFLVCQYGMYIHQGNTRNNSSKLLYSNH
jgi:hypothetical protein